MNLVSCGQSRNAFLSCPMHTHSEWEMIYQSLGDTCATAGGKRLRVKEGELLLVPPNTPHNTVGEGPIKDMNLRLRQCDLPSSPVVVADSNGAIRALFALLLEENADPDGEALIKEKTAELICLYVKRLLGEEACPEEILRLKHLLARNVGNTGFDLGETLNSFGYHPDYLRRRFKQHAGLSPGAYFTALGMEYAKELLILNGFLSVNEVAYQCGYEDGLYFSKVFKRHTGLSPSAFRKKHGKNE